MPPPYVAEVLLGLLRGEGLAWPQDSDAGFDHRFLDACASGGVAPLVHHLLTATSVPDASPASVREPLARASRMQAANDVLREREVLEVLSALADAGVEAMLLKGAALAYTHYPEPSLRTRCDTDVLIRPADLGLARQVLERLGYERSPGVSGSLVSYEECHLKQDGALAHVVDLHWQVNNRQVFTLALPCADVFARSIPVPGLGPSARALCPADALLLACMHRAGHLGANGDEGNRLIWLYDIHLLASKLTASEWRDFVNLCAAGNMRRIVADAFSRVRADFATPVPPEVADSLTRGGHNELSAAYLEPGRRGFLLVELRALGTWQARATLLRERFFPPASYLRAKYRSTSASSSRWLLPWWYARRAAEGVWKAARS